MAIDNIPIEVTENTQEVTLEIDDTSHPYYVGARAYVTQIPEGAIVTVIDKFGKTEATLLDGNYGNITDISYDPDTKTLKKVNGVVIDDVVTLSDVAISNDYEDLDNLPDIDAIIDAHPITNIQDGVITDEKLSSSLKLKVGKVYKTVALMIADEGLSVGTYVKTLGYHNEDDGMGLEYVIVDSGYEHKCFEILDNGLYAVALLNISDDNNKPSGDIGALIQNALSYQGSGKSFSYATAYGVTYPTAIDDGYVADTYYIDCSTLSWLMINGIDFEHSKYGGGNNERINGSPYIPDDFYFNFFRVQGKIRSAYQQALYFAAKGNVYYPNDDYDNIRIGDVVFFAQTEHESPYYFMNIDHVAIYLGECGLDGNGKRRHQFIGNNGFSGAPTINTFFYTNNEDYFRQIVLCAGVEKPPFASNIGKNILLDGNTSHNLADGNLRGIYMLSEPLKSFTAYTLKIKTNSNSLHKVSVSVPNKSIYADGYSISALYKKKYEAIFHFVTGDMSSNSVSNNCKFRIYAGENSDNISVTNVSLAEGWQNDVINNVEGYINIASLSITGSTGSIEMHNKHLKIDVSFSSPQSGNHTIGSFGSILTNELNNLQYTSVFLDTGDLAYAQVYNGNVNLFTSVSGYSRVRSFNL